MFYNRRVLYYVQLWAIMAIAMAAVAQQGTGKAAQAAAAVKADRLVSGGMGPLEIKAKTATRIDLMRRSSMAAYAPVDMAAALAKADLPASGRSLPAIHGISISKLREDHRYGPVAMPSMKAPATKTENLLRSRDAGPIQKPGPVPE